MEQTRFQNYFIVDGEKYYTGTIFIVDDHGKYSEACFICYDIHRLKYVYKIKDRIWHVDSNYFRRMFINVTNKRDENARTPTIKTRDDLEIDGLFIGWVWYVFLMAISCIFKEAIGLWIFISIVFFVWRADKIKREGTYIEW